MALNEEQEKALDAVTAFLLNNKPAIIIDGSGGTGKSYLIAEFQKTLLQKYKDLCAVMGEEVKYKSVHITSTTNKACDSLSVLLHSQVPTIHKFLSLILKENYKTGEETLIPSDSCHTHSNEIIVIDEASMINFQLFYYINQLCVNCKIIFVGDKYQLAPVKEKISSIYQQNYDEISLNTFMRQQNSILVDLANTCKQAVKDQSIKLQLNKGVIDLLSADETFELLQNQFINPDHTNKVCCYTNACCLAYNKYIHENVRKYTEPFYIGQYLIVNNAVTNINNDVILHTEDEVKITDLSNEKMATIKGKNSDVKLKVYQVTVRNTNTGSQHTALVPSNLLEYKSILKSLARDKDWAMYFTMKNRLLDLRQGDACTVHKAQGATVDTVLVDLDNLSTCNIPSMFYRLLYVACTRARERVCFFGSLSKKYGEIV